MDNCPRCGTELPIIGGGAFCPNCGEKVDRGAAEATTAFGPAAASTSAAGGPRPAPSTWTMPQEAPTAVVGAGALAGGVGGEPGGEDPYEAYFRPAPGEQSPHTRTQVMPAVEPGAYPPGFAVAPQPAFIPTQPAYDQPIDYQAAPGRPYSEPYDGPYADEYSDPPPPPPRSNRGAMIGIGVAAAAVAVIIVSLITLGGGSAKPQAAQGPGTGSTDVVTPTDPGSSSAPTTNQQATTQPSATSTAPSATPHAPGLIELGDKGAEVKWLQTRLKQLHAYNGPVSGTFDQATLTAVQQFQNRTHTSDPSGVVGRSTKTALIAAGSKPKMSLTGGVFGGGDNKPKPDDVKRLQNALSAALGQKVNASGNYDMATMAAVLQYQSSVGLGPDGTVSDKTWSALQSGKVPG